MPSSRERVRSTAEEGVKVADELRRFENGSADSYTVSESNGVDLDRDCSKSTEAVGVQCETSMGRVMIFNIYNPGVDIDPAEYREFFLPNSIICGDFNAHKPLWGGTKLDRRGQILGDLVMESDKMVLNDGRGTCIVRGNLSALDLTIVDSKLASLATWDVKDYDLGSDHLPVITSVKVPFEVKSSTTFWNFSKANWFNFCTFLDLSIQNIDMSSLVESVYSRIVNIILEGAETFIPQSTTERTKHQTPWNMECEKD
ncbi:uncharacterized protein LOC106478890 [Limulus polyphemus]|uniref:Uncharacterized protein LOC106478890 n=1 Tax=Limulus polyphemus TaxID=6850 RepID=A0ABM1C659_LIMPO|nr:uncharacterized protein LOC106478890 [Limulus polyphemus]